MIKYSVYVFFALLGTSSFTQLGYAQLTKSTNDNTNSGITTVSYIADFISVFPNPERGWHNRRDVDGRGRNDDRDFSDVRVAGHTLVHSYLRLDDFKNTDTIPQSYLDDFQEALDAIRVSGLKIILAPNMRWTKDNLQATYPNGIQCFL